MSSLGTLDMVELRIPRTVPERFEGRPCTKHNPPVTLMRTTAEIGPAQIAEKLFGGLGLRPCSCRWEAYR